jgi:hypothetical protein
VFCAFALTLAPGRGQQNAASIEPILQENSKLHRKGARAIPNRYIVVLDQDAAGKGADIAAAARQARDVLQTFGREPDFVYARAITGFAAELTESERLRSVRIHGPLRRGGLDDGGQHHAEQSSMGA